MLDTAQDAGVIFSPILSNDKDLSLPAELLPLCDKAIAQGRAVRRGGEPVTFTNRPDERWQRTVYDMDGNKTWK